jgi:hypothetical protein
LETRRVISSRWKKRDYCSNQPIGNKESNNQLVEKRRVLLCSRRRRGECMDPEGSGVNPGEGNRGGPGPPSGEPDKQLIGNSGGDNTLMKQPGGQEDESGVTTRTHHAQNT